MTDGAVVTDVNERLPAVPLPMTIGAFLEAGARVAPDRTIVGLEAVRPLRWVAADPPAGAGVEAAVGDPGRVEVSIGGCARAVVLVADGYDPAPPAACGPLTGERPPSPSADELYEQRRLRHRGARRVVRQVHATGAGGLRAALTAPASPGALLEAAGQLAGHWTGDHAAPSGVALPARIARVDLYGPYPGSGAQVECAIRFTGRGGAVTRCDVELVHGAGVWARMRDVAHRYVDVGAAVARVMRHPECGFLADRRDGYWIVREPWSSSAGRDLVMLCYLGEDEQRAYASLNPRAQRHWALGRVAAKDAVRQWLADRGAGPILPADVRIENDASGRPWATVPGVGELSVSLAHRNLAAVAAVAAVGERSAGIDIEVIEPRGEQFTRLAMTDHEVRLGARRPPDEWVTRVWTVKEAVAKAAGSGLGGRPKDFVVEKVDGDWSLAQGRWAHTSREGDLVVSTVRERALYCPGRQHQQRPEPEAIGVCCSARGDTCRP